MNATTAKITINQATIMVTDENIEALNGVLRNVTACQEKYVGEKWTQMPVDGAYIQLEPTLTITTKVYGLPKDGNK